jgi:hypothetical protein
MGEPWHAADLASGRSPGPALMCAVAVRGTVLLPGQPAAATLTQRIDMDDIPDAIAHQGLSRVPDDRVSGGVAAGLGRRLGPGPPAVGRARRPVREHLLPAGSRAAVTPMSVRPDFERLAA